MTPAQELEALRARIEALASTWDAEAQLAHGQAAAWGPLSKHMGDGCTGLARAIEARASQLRALVLVAA